MTLTFEEARKCVQDRVRSHVRAQLIGRVSLESAFARVLAEEVPADRNYPPFNRSARDGFAIRSADVPGRLRVVGEVRAGEAALAPVEKGTAIEIMTGAPVPIGADSVIMVEHVTRDGGDVIIDRSVAAGDNIVLEGSEAPTGHVLLHAGTYIGYPEIAVLATVGRAHVNVFRKPRVAIIATGDELVDVDELPARHQIRNSNAHSLAAQVIHAGGEARILGIARDSVASTHEQIARGLESDLLFLSGGVSAGKYDIVEKVLADFGAEFYFDRVLVQPGQPLAFGRIRDRFFFGFPGNPVSTMVTFEMFGRIALNLIGGHAESPLVLSWARLTKDFRQKKGLTRVLPALVNGGGEVTPTRWQGSGDVAAVARSNAFLVSDPDREQWDAGDWMRVLIR